MAANATWAADSSAIHPHTRFEIEDTKSSKIALDNGEPRDSGLARIVGNSDALRRLLEMVRIAAPTDATVLIRGRRQLARN